MTHNADDFVEGLQRQIIEQARQQYSEVVVDHWLNPRNPGPMQDPDGHARIKGPCGDTMEVFVRVEDGIVAEARFLTDGCITSIVSGSMAVELATGKSVAESAGLVSQSAILEALGGLPEGNEHCALLAANTLRAAIEDYVRTRNEPWKRAYRRP
jgi:nitrogen fixation NifU-like protein